MLPPKLMYKFVNYSEYKSIRYKRAMALLYLVCRKMTIGDVDPTHFFGGIWIIQYMYFDLEYSWFSLYYVYLWFIIQMYSEF